MKKLIYAVMLQLLFVVPARAQAIDGDWQGTLRTSGVEIRVVVHITRDEKGGLKATMDSPDQGATGIPVTTVTVADSMLKFEVQRIGGSFEGKINAGVTTISGTWKQAAGSLPLELTRFVAPPAKARVAKPSDIDGDWEGALESPAGSLRLVLHIRTYEDGMTATLDSPDQGGFGIPVTSIARDAENVRFEMKQLAGSFRGTLDKDLATLGGTWTQFDNSLSLVLKRIRK